MRERASKVRTTDMLIDKMLWEEFSRIKNSIALSVEMQTYPLVNQFPSFSSYSYRSPMLEKLLSEKPHIINSEITHEFRIQRS